ncbi:hypothetical protein MMC07_003056 [Pseudocyphellaria aurata]|nr:hypothetical protein [Pseudocyphellaria aurata]
MPVSKRRRAHLIEIRKIKRKPNARARNESDKTRENERDNASENESHNTSENGANASRYWHDSPEDEYSDSDDNAASEGEEKKELAEKQTEAEKVEAEAVLRWNQNGEAKLRGAWGTGSLATEERKQKKKREMQQQAAQCYDIGAMFKKAFQEVKAPSETERTREEVSG